MTNFAAIILAAGEGKRMKALGSNLPKVMLPILGKPVLSWVISKILEVGIKNIILVVSPKSQHSVKKYFGENFKGAKITYILQEKQVGPAQAIALALPKVKSDYFLVAYGDSLADQNIVKNLIDKLSQNSNLDGVLAVRVAEDPTRSGIVKYRGDRVVKIIEKPKNNPQSNHAVVGIFILKTDIYKLATENIKFHYGKEEFPAEYLLRKGAKIITWQFEGKCVDVGKPQDLFNAGQLLAKNPIKCIVFDADNTLYNTHQVSKFADLDAVKIVSERTGINVQELYQQWQGIVDTLSDSKVPQKRTRLYSYNLLLEKFKVSTDLLDPMYEKFTRSLTHRIKAAKNIKDILSVLDQTKIVITEDVKSLVRAKLKAVGLYKFFEKIITSDDTKTMKPSKKYYGYLRSIYQPQEVLVVGDDWQKDLRIPAQLGMQVLFVGREDDLAKLKEIKKSPKSIHIMGIAGAGAAAVAGIAKDYGYLVTGCDLVGDSPYTQNLKVALITGHHPQHLEGASMLVISPAVEKLDGKNPEIQIARERKIPILTWQEFQGKYLQKDKFVICISGAYGKSTTTAMLSQILVDAGLDPTCEIGAKVLVWQKNFRVGNSNYYVCEGDEYNNNFLSYKPDIAVVLNMAWDHPDFFKNQNDLICSYQKFIGNIKPGGTLVIPKDPQLKNLANSARRDIKTIEVVDFGKLNLSLIGSFRKENANAALTVAKILNIDLQSAKKSVQKFKGTGRRLEYKGKIGSVKFYDDYAVQSYTIEKTSSALKEKFKDKKVLLVLEPHTFSRIRVFFDDFVKSLKESKVDQIFITEVYAAREKGDRKILAKKLANALGAKAKYTGSIEQTATYIKKHLKNFPVVCSMGAGDSYKLYDLLKKVSPSTR